MYAMIAMQSDIAFTVRKFSQISHDPIVCHCIGLDKTLCYLRETFDLGLFYDYSVISLTIKPVRFADSANSNDSFDCRFTHSMTIILGPAVYIWSRTI